VIYFSITKALTHHWYIRNHRTKTKLKGRKKKHIFDRVMDTDTGCFPGVIVKSLTFIEKILQLCRTGMTNLKFFLMQKSWGPEVMTNIADMYKDKMVGNMEPCMAFNLANILQKNVAKATGPVEYKAGEKLNIMTTSFLDQHFVTHRGRKIKLLLDPFFEAKIRSSIFDDELCQESLYIRNKVKSIQCDNAGKISTNGYITYIYYQV
jgi:hypothetical protein